MRGDVVVTSITTTTKHALERTQRMLTGPQRGSGRPGSMRASRAPPPLHNLQIMAFAPKRVSFGIKAIKTFWGIFKNKALTIWGPSEYEALGQSAPPCPAPLCGPGCWIRCTKDLGCPPLSCTVPVHDCNTRLYTRSYQSPFPLKKIFRWKNFYLIMLPLPRG